MTSIVRSLLSEIRLIPGSESLMLELVGELENFLTLSKSKRQRPEAASLRGVRHCWLRG